MTEEFNRELQKQTQPKRNAKERTTDLENRAFEIRGAKGKKNEKRKESLQYLQNTIKRNNICIMEMSGEKKERDRKHI